MNHTNEIEENAKYRADLEFPMNNLAIALFEGEAGVYSDADIVEKAASKIKTLKRMILATGFSKAMLAAIMEE